MKTVNDYGLVISYTDANIKRNIHTPNMHILKIFVRIKAKLIVNKIQ